MPELSPKQLTIWLLIAAAVLMIGARALQGAPAEKLELQGEVGVMPGDGETGLGFEDSAGGEGNRDGPRIHVHVAGGVRRPGLYQVPPESRVADAIQRAGGAVGRADLDQVNLAAAVIDGQQVMVPRRGEPTASAGAVSVVDTATPPNGMDAPISLAGAQATDLETIDGIGPVTAAKILDFRDQNGGVGSIEELDSVHGIGPATMQTLREALVP